MKRRIKNKYDKLYENRDRLTIVMTPAMKEALTTAAIAIEPDFLNKPTFFYEEEREYKRWLKEYYECNGKVSIDNMSL